MLELAEKDIKIYSICVQIRNIFKISYQMSRDENYNIWEDNLDESDIAESKINELESKVIETIWNETKKNFS